MILRISPNDGVPIYLQIINQIKYLVASGRLAVGEQLPSVRKLAETLLINPNTVARAYRELESAGMLSTRRGTGVFVSDGGSPLARQEKTQIIRERVDALLAESRHLNYSVEDLVKMVRERAEKIKD
jgi:GntR family transcriptional regulator